MIYECKRIGWIDQCRGILFFMVILVHTGCCPQILRYVIDPIFLPGFFALSGYLYKDKPFKMKMYSIVNTLIIPFFTYSFLIALLHFFRSRFDIQVFAENLFRLIKGGDELWFIPCLAVVELLFALIRSVSNKTYFLIASYSLSITAFLLLTTETHQHNNHLFWNVDTSLWCISYFLIGFCVKHNYLTPLPKAKKLIWFGFFLFICIEIIVGYLEMGEADMHNNYAKNKISYMIMSSFFCYWMFCIMPLFPISKILTNLGKFTLFAFAFHAFIYRTIEKNLTRLPYSEYFIDEIIATVLTVNIVIILGIFFEKKCPFLLGKTKILR